MALPEYEQLAASAPNRRALAPANLHAIEESAATGEAAALYNHFRAHFGRPDVPGILKCFATHPPLLSHMMDLSESLIFADGHLSRKHKEMIATLVSGQNACPYCADSHGYFLRMHGGSCQALAAIQNNDTASPELTPAEQALLSFAGKVNLDSSRITPTDVDQVRLAGWGELQIAEAVHVAALFATFNRVANAFGLASQGLLEIYENHNPQDSSKDEASERTTP